MAVNECYNTVNADIQHSQLQSLENEQPCVAGVLQIMKHMHNSLHQLKVHRSQTGKKYILIKVHAGPLLYLILVDKTP